MYSFTFGAAAEATTDSKAREVGDIETGTSELKAAGQVTSLRIGVMTLQCIDSTAAA